jgi:hypothetical protein
MFFCKKKQQNIAGMVALTIKKGFNVQTKKQNFLCFVKQIYIIKKREDSFLCLRKDFLICQEV